MRNLRNVCRPSGFVYAVLAGSLLVIGGCWGSKFTLIAPDKAKVDRAYVGDWDAVNPKGDHAAMTIRNIDDKLYYVETREKDNAEIARYIGFIADVKGATFAHVRTLKDDGAIDDEWMTMRIALADKNKLTLEQLDDKFLKDKPINSSEQLRQVLEQNLNNPALYAKDETITATRIVKK